jgi:hypothetical protein
VEGNINIIFFHGLGLLTSSSIDAGGNFMLLVGTSKPDRMQERSQIKGDKLVLQEWGFCGRADNPPKETK